MHLRKVSYIINLVNSIIGVSILAIPYCMHECGVLLGIILLFFLGWLSTQSCILILTASQRTSKHTLSSLTLYALGQIGKMCIELSVVGLMAGSLVAFFVVMGDLGPQIVCEVSGVPNTYFLKLIVLMTLTFCLVLPLSLLRNVNSLASASTVSLLFYAVFIFHLMTMLVGPLVAGTLFNNIRFWRLQGIMKCLPILGLSFACQTQLFMVYNSLPEPSIPHMRDITKSSIAVATGIYSFIGTFGYLAFASQSSLEVSGFQGNLLNMYPETSFAIMIKFGFVLSVAISYPLILFPCRASIYSFVYVQHRRAAVSELTSGDQVSMPDVEFRRITIAMLLVTLLVSILVPNMEFILALTGAITGSLINFIFPALIYLKCICDKTSNCTNPQSKHTRHIKAKIILMFGMVMLTTSSLTTFVQHDYVDPGELTAQLSTEVIDVTLKMEKSLQSFSIKVNDAEQLNNNVAIKRRILTAQGPIIKNSEVRQKPMNLDSSTVFQNSKHIKYSHGTTLQKSENSSQFLKLNGEHLNKALFFLQHNNNKQPYRKTQMNVNRRQMVMKDYTFTPKIISVSSKASSSIK